MIPRLEFSALTLVLLFAALGWFPQSAFAGYLGESSSDPFVQMRTNTGEEMMRTLPNQESRYDGTYDLHWALNGVPLFVPPPAPLLGAEPSELPRGGFGGLPGADCAHEIFYGGYAILAQQHKLSRAEITRVADYRRTRAELFTEIKATIDQLAGSTPAARRTALTELATKQAGRLRELETEAEALWNEFAWAGSTFGYDIEIVTGAPRAQPDAEQSELFLAAYFFGGLSIDERQLLLEMASERVLASLPNGGTHPSDLFFLPATARLRLPADLPSALASSIREFVREKNLLKDELRGAIRQPHFQLTSTRTKRLAELAGKQAPRFAALEALAEKIRVGLAGIGFPNRNENLALPDDLTQRVGSFYARKVKVRRALLERLWSLRNEFIGASFEIVRKGDGLAIVQGGDYVAPPALLADFNAKQAREYAALAAESETLRRDIQHYLEKHPQRTARTVDQLAADFASAYTARENEERCRDYRRAVLEPGLSPAQRRLMLRAALAELELASKPAHP
jgi:hypothetical protein